jgi:hypothetical protein
MSGLSIVSHLAAFFASKKAFGSDLLHEMKKEVTKIGRRLCDLDSVGLDHLSAAVIK